MFEVWRRALILKNHTPDGRFVLVNRGQVLRELTVGEYERLRASGAASLATVGNLLLLFFFLRW
jgi:hypothetical protein